MKTRHLTRAAYGLAAAILGITLMVGAPLLGVGLLVGVVFFVGMVMTMGVLITWLVGQLDMQEPPAEVREETDPKGTDPLTASPAATQAPTESLVRDTEPVDIGALQTSADADFLAAAGIARL